MNKTTAKTIFEEALSYCKENYPDELEWAESISQETFKRLTVKQFLSEYCWVVYASGFKVSTVEALFPRLQRAFKGFNLNSLKKMRSLSEVLSVFNNERKANCFLKGSRDIADEGFQQFKRRLKEKGTCVLESLPGIGPITRFHLAKNIGLVDEAKPDIWLVRTAEACETTVNELVTFLSEKYDLSRHVVDVVLWRYGADNNLGLRKANKRRSIGRVKSHR